MATKDYNISDLRMLSPTYRSTSGSERLSIRVFRGICLININVEKSPRPIFNKHLSFTETYQIAKYMTDMLKSEPNSDKTLVYNAYDKNQKKRVLDYVLIFRKDERKIFHIVIKTNGQTFDFPIKSVSSFAFGTGEIPEDERSNVEWGFLINFIKNLIPIQMQLSNFPLENNNSGGQGYQRQGGYTPRPNSNGEFASSRGLPGDEDMFV